MGNPIFQSLANSQYGNMSSMVQQFNKFKAQFKGNPQQQVQNLLNSGKVTQEQYDRAVQMANAMRKMIGI